MLAVANGIGVDSSIKEKEKEIGEVKARGLVG
jgi:hypothetical protein